MTTKTAANPTADEAQARLVELEERIAAARPVTADEWAAAEAAVKLAARVDNARVAREAAAAEAAHLAEVDALKERFAVEVSASAARLLDARAAVVTGLEAVRLAADDHSRLIGELTAEVRRLAQGGPTPGIDAYKGPFGGWVVAVGGWPGKHHMEGGVGAGVDPNLGRHLGEDAIEEANPSPGRNGTGFDLPVPRRRSDGSYMVSTPTIASPRPASGVVRGLERLAALAPKVD